MKLAEGLSPEILDIARELEQLRRGVSATIEIVLKRALDGDPSRIAGFSTKVFQSIEELEKRRTSVEDQC